MDNKDKAEEIVVKYLNGGTTNDLISCMGKEHVGNPCQNCGHKSELDDKDESFLPWKERVTMLSINPDAATRHDIARMAAELSEEKK